MNNPAPTDAAIREYLSGYYEQSDQYERFKIKSIGASVEGPQCRTAQVYCEWQNGDNVGNDATQCETVKWTLWIEGGSVYGEY